MTITRYCITFVGWAAAATAIIGAQLFLHARAYGQLLESIALPTTAFAAGICCLFLVGMCWRRWQANESHKPVSKKQNFDPRLVVATAIAFIFVTGFWYGVRLEGFKAYEFRDTFSLLMSLPACLLLAATVPGPRWINGRGSLESFVERRLLFIGAALYLAVSAFMAAVVLDGIPHMNDTVGYVYEGRILWSGHLALDNVPYTDLFDGLGGSLQGARGYYPIGWPLVLGAFDALGVGWLANPVLGTAAIFVVYFLTKEISDARVALLTALLLAASPWFMLSATDQLTHVASTLWLTVYFLGFLRAIHDNDIRWAALAGFGLLAAILTRPQDAFLFALPSIVYAAWLFFTRIRQHGFSVAVIGAGGVLGACLYFSLNAFYRGTYFVSVYGTGRYGLHQSPHDLLTFLSWVHESVSEVNLLWLAGVFPMLFFVAFGATKVFSRRRRDTLFLISTLFFCVMYGLFVFKSRAYMGPRWYLPMAPALAYLASVGFVEAYAQRNSERISWLMQGYIRLGIVAVTMAWFLAVPIQAVALHLWPPHGVSGNLVASAQAAGIDNAVVVLPVDYFDEVTGKPHYRIHRNSLSVMRFPFDELSIVFVQETSDLSRKVGEMFPEREILCATGTPGQFQFPKC